MNTSRDEQVTDPEHTELTRSDVPRQSHSSDKLAFFRMWLREPLVTATCLPSSRNLSRALAAAIDPSIPGAVLELGPGTGPVTAALVERGIAPDRLVLIELMPEFSERLRGRYPSARVITGDAFSAPSLLAELGLGPLSAVVSCLPLYGRPPSWRQKFLLDLLSLGGPGHRFVQATNFPASPIPIDSRKIEASSSPRIWLNVFPAVVWTYRLAK